MFVRDIEIASVDHVNGSMIHDNWKKAMTIIIDGNGERYVDFGEHYASWLALTGQVVSIATEPCKREPHTTWAHLEDAS